MIRSLELAVRPEFATNINKLKNLVAQNLNIQSAVINHVEIVKRSIDARSKQVLTRLKMDVYTDHDQFIPENIQCHYQDVKNAPKVVIIGSGPAGLFGALNCLEKGLKPIILERGKAISERKRDIATLSTKGLLNEESNYCFGEGGAGTFSDGKLYTRSSKRGNIKDILKALVFHGADPDILIDAHPHIGSDMLPGIMKNIRKTLLSYGGEIFFNTKACDITVEKNVFKGVIDQHGQFHEGIALLLACGHSANDIYELFSKKNWTLEAKPFALGVRIEHPQSLIDDIQYHQNPRDVHLPAAKYSLTAQVDGRGIFSFCMCPGGLIIPASTARNHLVVNGMSNSKRSSPYANSGIVVTIHTSDYKDFENGDALAGLRFRTALEHIFFEAGGSSYQAPAQKVYDFIKGKPSTELNETTYHLGLKSVDFNTILPPFVADTLKNGLLDFNKKMRGFLTNEAQLIGLESRTSSPVRIPRHVNYEHPDIENLYPSGEGAGYAGGIVSSAIDGRNCIDAFAQKLNN